MRNKLIILAAIAMLALAGVLVAGSSSTSSMRNAAAVDSTFSIFDLTRRAGDLPEENYPAH